MRKRKITSRQKEIIISIAKNPMDTPITISDIANKLNISTRTVLREMSKIEDWFYENDFNFIKKPGVGLILNEPLEEKQFLVELLDEANVEKEYTKEERKLLILSNLLTTQEPIKTYYFIKLLRVSEATLNNDISLINTWLENLSIKLIRKPGLGIYLEGNEKNFRHAYINLIHEFYNDREILEMISNKEQSIKTKSTIEISSEDRLLNLIDKSIIKSVENILIKSINKLNMNLSDSAYVGLVVHISLAIQRIKNGENIKMDKDALNELKKLEQFEKAYEIAKNIEEEFNINLPLDEVGYITMHLRGCKLRMMTRGKTFGLDDMQLLSITKKVIYLAQTEFNIALEEDQRLLEDLMNHLGPSICRMNMDMKIRNPLINEIKSDYYDIYNKMDKIISPIKDVVNSKFIPESEIAYITMHFAAAIERNLMLYTNINIVISCPTGIGTSRLVSTKIQKRFPNINVLETISALNIDEEHLIKKRVDLIVSTIELNTSLNYICVDTRMSEDDEKLIKKTILEIAKNKVEKIKYNKSDKTEDKKNDEDIFRLMTISKDMMKFLDEIKIIKNSDVKNLDQLLNFSSSLYTDSYKDLISIKGALQKRIDISSPYIDDIDMYLLHCTTDKVTSMKMAIINTKDEVIFNEEEKSKNIVFMLLPSESKDYQRQFLSKISATILDNEDLINAIRSVDKDEIRKKLKSIAIEFYKNQIDFHIENNIEKESLVCC